MVEPIIDTFVAGLGYGDKKEQVESFVKVLSQSAKETKKSTEKGPWTKLLHGVGRAAFYDYTDLGQSIQSGFLFTQTIVVMLWIIVLVLIGLTVWRATLGSLEAQDSLSVGIYVATAFSFVNALIALTIYLGAKTKVQEEVDNALDRVKSALQKYFKKISQHLVSSA